MYNEMFVRCEWGAPEVDKKWEDILSEKMQSSNEIQLQYSIVDGILKH